MPRRLKRNVDFLSNPGKDFFPVNSYRAGCVNAEPHLVSLNAQNGNGDIIPNLEGFTDPPSQYQHCCSP